MSNLTVSYSTIWEDRMEGKQEGGYLCLYLFIKMKQPQRPVKVWVEMYSNSRVHRGSLNLSANKQKQNQIGTVKGFPHFMGTFQMIRRFNGYLVSKRD